MKALLSSLLVVMAVAASAQERQVVMPAVIQCDTNDAAVTATKLEAGLALALDLTERFEYIPSSVRDSLIALTTSAEVTTLQATSIVQAHVAAFVHCVRLGTLVRTEVTLRSGDSLSVIKSGIGYAAIRHHNQSGLIADPAILAAIQRAVCVALGDSTLYSSIPEDLQVVPTELISIGGIAFEDDNTRAPRWDLFESKTVVSFDLAINLVHELQAQKRVTVVDLETRDSMFAKGGLFLIENNRPVSNTELRILSAFDVRQVIIGSFKRTEQGALLSLKWCAVEADGRYTVQREAKEVVAEDSAEALRNALKAALAVLTAG